MAITAIIDGGGNVVNVEMTGAGWVAPAGFTGQTVPEGTHVAPGWTFAGGTFSPPYVAPITPTLAQQAGALLAAGLTVASTGTPSLDGVYACDMVTQSHVTSEITALLLNSAFADGGATVTWPDTSGALHTFNATQFKSWATAMAAFIAGCAKCINGASSSLPSASVTIA